MDTVPGESQVVKIHALGRFEIILNGEPLRFVSKAPRKPLALLKALLCAGGKAVSQSRLQDALWPEADAWLARKALNTTLYRLRSILGSKEIIAYNDGWISLDPRLCWVDAWAFEQAIAQARDPGAWHSALRLYGGAFLTDSDHTLAVEARDRLRRKYIQTVLQVGQSLESHGDTGAAIQLYEVALDADCTAEDLYRAVMRCLAREGKHAAVGAAYQRCRTMLWRHFAIGPSQATEQLYRDAHTSRSQVSPIFTPRPAAGSYQTVRVVASSGGVAPSGIVGASGAVDRVLVPGIKRRSY